MRKHVYFILAIVAALVVATLCSCATPRRCARKFPPVVVSDTLVHWQRDTVRIAGRERVDTLINLRTLRDTTYITTERVRVQWRVVSDSLVQLQVQCPDDTTRSSWASAYAARAVVAAATPQSGWTWLERVGLLAIVAVVLMLVLKFM